jgi:hypothetical protein
MLGLRGWRRRREEAAEAGEEGGVAVFFGEEGGVEFLGFLEFASKELEGFGSGCCAGYSRDCEVLGVLLKIQMLPKVHPLVSRK